MSMKFCLVTNWPTAHDHDNEEKGEECRCIPFGIFIIKIEKYAI